MGKVFRGVPQSSRNADVIRHSQVSFQLLVIPYPPFSTMNGRQRNATNEQIWGK